MGSGFKSRGVHHWENSLRLAATRTGGCFVVCHNPAALPIGFRQQSSCLTFPFSLAVLFTLLLRPPGTRGGRCGGNKKAWPQL